MYKQFKKKIKADVMKIVGFSAVIVLTGLVFTCPVSAEQSKTSDKDQAKIIKSIKRDLKSKDEQKRSDAITWTINNPGLCDPEVITKALKKEKNFQTRALLLEALRINPDPRAASHIRKYLKDQEELVRQYAAYALRPLKPEGADKDLARAYGKEKDVIVLKALVYALGAYRTDTALNVLNKAVAHANEQVVIQAARELSTFRTDEADSLLISLSDKSNKELKKIALNAGKRIKMRVERRAEEERRKKAEKMNKKR